MRRVIMFMANGTSVQLVVESVRVSATVHPRPHSVSKANGQGRPRRSAGKAAFRDRQPRGPGRTRSPVWCQRDAWDAHYIGGFRYQALPSADEQARRMR